MGQVAVVDTNIAVSTKIPRTLVEIDEPLMSTPLETPNGPLPGS